MTLYIRDDDVLVTSTAWDDPFLRFKDIHELICKAPDKLLHVPTILVTEIQQYPKAISYVKNETHEGRMAPQLHGLEHIDYNKLSFEDIKDHLFEAKDWMFFNLGVIATIWYTPWGANSTKLTDAALSAGMTLIDCSETLGPGQALQMVKNNVSVDEKEVLFHWWQRGSNLNKLVDYASR